MLKSEKEASWCNHYVCWVADVEEMTEGNYECNLNCAHCDKFDGKVKIKSCVATFKQNIQRLYRDVIGE